MFGMVLQQLVEIRQLNVSDCLLDDNNVPLKVCSTMIALYLIFFVMKMSRTVPINSLTVVRHNFHALMYL
jgi:hypothetical protein